MASIAKKSSRDVVNVTLHETPRDRNPLLRLAPSTSAVDPSGIQALQIITRLDSLFDIADHAKLPASYIGRYVVTEAELKSKERFVPDTLAAPLFAY